MKMNFELSKPFMPFEQLLAVLPAASKNLIPPAFQSLMLSDNSPIIDFYPQEFEQVNDRFYKGLDNKTSFCLF